MESRPALLIASAALTFAAGCAHPRVVGRPPTTAEIDAIERAADGTMALRYVDPEHPCAGALCVVEDIRPVSDIPPVDIRRIVGVNERQIRVVAKTGDTWNLDVSTLAGVTTQSRAAGKGAAAGGITGLAVGGAIVFLAYFFSGLPADAPENQRSKPLSAPIAIGTCLISAAVGAGIGAIVGDHTISSQAFDFGGGHQLAPASFSR
jgi:hypothetical protein